MSAETGCQPLFDSIGEPIRRVRRVFYTYRGAPDRDFGPVELTLGETTVLLDNESDGESLRVVPAAWHDSFVEPLSPENREFVEQSGKWTAYDVSTEEAWSTFIGDRLASVELISNPAGNETGVVLHTARGGVLRVEVEADEVFVNELIAATNPS